MAGMYVTFTRRSRTYTRRKGKEPHRTVVVRLMQSQRAGKSRQRYIAHLGTCREPVDRSRHRFWFYERCNKVLDRLDLSADDRAKIAAQLAARIPPPMPEEIAEIECRTDEMADMPSA